MNVSTRSRILVLALTTFVAGSNEYILAGILGLVSSGLDVSVQATGQLITVYALVYGLCVPVVVALLGHVGRRKVLVSAMTVYAMVSALCYLVDDFRMFAVLRVLQALSGGLAVVTALSTAADVAGPARKGRAIATVIMGFTASLIVAVPVGRTIALHAGWHVVFLIVGGLGLVVAWLQYAVLPSLGPAATIPLKRQLALLGQPVVLGSLSVTILWMAGYVMTYSYLTPYLTGVPHMSPSAITLILLLFGLASLVGSRLGGSHTDRHGHHATLAVAKIVQIMSLLGLVVTASLLPHGATFAVTAVLIVWSLSAWACGPSQQVRIAALDPQASGVLVGLNQSAMQIGIASGTALGGIVIDTSGIASLPMFSALVVVVALVLMITLKRAIGRRDAVNDPGETRHSAKPRPVARQAET